MGQYVSAKRGRWRLGMRDQCTREATEDEPGRNKNAPALVVDADDIVAAFRVIEMQIWGAKRSREAVSSCGVDDEPSQEDRAAQHPSRRRGSALGGTRLPSFSRCRVSSGNPCPPWPMAEAVTGEGKVATTSRYPLQTRHFAVMPPRIQGPEGTGYIVLALRIIEACSLARPNQKRSAGALRGTEYLAAILIDLPADRGLH